MFNKITYTIFTDIENNNSMRFCFQLNMKRTPRHFLQGKINRSVSQTWLKFIANRNLLQQRRTLNHLFGTSPIKLRTCQCKIITWDF